MTRLISLLPGVINLLFLNAAKPRHLLRSQHSPECWRPERRPRAQGWSVARRKRYQSLKMLV